MSAETLELRAMFMLASDALAAHSKRLRQDESVATELTAVGCGVVVSEDLETWVPVFANSHLREEREQVSRLASWVFPDETRSMRASGTARRKRTKRGKDDVSTLRPAML